MTATLQTLLLLLAIDVVVAVVAQRIKTPPSILLVIAGVALALSPGLPTIELAPELVRRPCSCRCSNASNLPRRCRRRRRHPRTSRRCS